MVKEGLATNGCHRSYLAKKKESAGLLAATTYSSYITCSRSILHLEYILHTRGVVNVRHRLLCLLSRGKGSRRTGAASTFLILNLFWHHQRRISRPDGNGEKRGPFAERYTLLLLLLAVTTSPRLLNGHTYSFGRSGVLFFLSPLFFLESHLSISRDCPATAGRPAAIKVVSVSGKEFLLLLSLFHDLLFLTSFLWR